MAGRRRRDCRFLLGALLLLLVLFPVLEDMTRPILLTAVVGSIFVGGVVIVQPGRSRVRKAVALAAVQVGLIGLAVALRAGSRPYLFIVGFAIATTTALICYCIYCVVGYVLQANYIARDQIYAGISAYLMLGFAFGCIYYLMEMLAPGCFAVNTAKLDEPDLMYFSFVTLATLGYGDITPVARFARAVSQLEALAGTLYMAVFMARLVSMAVSAPPGNSAELAPTAHVSKPIGGSYDSG
jgi:hypothetical protein